MKHVCLHIFALFFFFIGIVKNDIFINYATNTGIEDVALFEAGARVRFVLFGMLMWAAALWFTPETFVEVEYTDFSEMSD